MVLDTMETSTDTLMEKAELYSGFFSDNPFIHNELPNRLFGITANPLPYDLWRDDLVGITLVLCTILLIYAFNNTRLQLKQQTRDFMAQPREHSGLFAVETSIESQSRMLMVVVLSVMGAVAMMAYSQGRFNISQHIISPHLLLSIYFVSFLLMFIVRRVTTNYVNWIFFPKSQQKIWKDTTSYLISIEALAFYPFLLIFVYFGLPFEKSITIFLFILLIIKILLTFKTFRIFFPKSYCLFHLFAYLCALEIMPLLALWKLLAIVTEILIVKY